MRRGTALVTGSSSGFGLRTCVKLNAAGFKVYASMRDLGRADALASALERSGFSPDGVELIALDVDDGEQRASVVERLLHAEGAIDVLVNNAGFMQTGFAEDTDEAELRAQFETNFFSVVALTRALLGPMRERRHGRVINMSSASGRRALPDHSAYCAAKFALEGWSESLRYEMVPYNVFVSLVEPGLFPTEIFGRNRKLAGRERSVHRKTAEALGADGRRVQALLAWADPDDVAKVVAKIAVADKPKLRYPVGVDAWSSALSVGPAVHAWWEQYMTSLLRR